MKQLVRTTGNFMLIDFQSGQRIAHDRPSVVQPTPFIAGRASAGQLEYLGSLPDEATDEMFADFYKAFSGEDVHASFADTFKVAEVKPTSNTRRRNTKKAETEE